MMKRCRSPYECFKNDRERLYALVSRDIRIVLTVAIAGIAGMSPILRATIWSWIA